MLARVCGTCVKIRWQDGSESNRHLADLESAALPIKLPPYKLNAWIFQALNMPNGKTRAIRADLGRQAFARSSNLSD